MTCECAGGICKEHGKIRLNGRFGRKDTMKAIMLDLLYNFGTLRRETVMAVAQAIYCDVAARGDVSETETKVFEQEEVNA